MMKRMKLDDEDFADLIRGEEDEDEDLVNHPSHYRLVLPNGDRIEAIDVIQAALGPSQTAGYCRGAAIKYLLRADKKKAHAQDLRKAAWYCNYAAGILEDSATIDD